MIVARDSSSNQRGYHLAGVLAISAAVLTIPMLVLGFLVQPQWPKLAFPLLVPYVPVAVAQAVFAVVALFWFRRLLNDRFHFHDTDGLIVTIIVGAVLLSVVGLVAKIGVLLVPRTSVVAIGLLVALPIVMLGIPLAVLSIIFGVKLLRLQDDLFGLLRPFAYVTIAAGVCFVTILLAPLGLVVDAVSNVILGVIFLRALRAPAVADFV